MGERYLKSPALILSEERDGQYILADIITRKMYEFDSGAYRVLNLLELPGTIDDVMAAIPAVDPEELHNYLRYLKDIAVLIDPDDDKQRDFVQMSRPAIRMFGAPEYDESSDGSGLVVVGIPFGRGNPLPNFTDGTPQVLRNLTNALNIDLRSIEYSSTLSELYDADVDFSDLQKSIAGKLLNDYGDLFVHPHEPARNVYHRIELLAGSLFKSNQRPVFIGGDHSISYPIIKACSASHENLHIIHLDAHTDTYFHRADSLYNVASHHHGNFAARCLELPNVHAMYQFGIRGVNNIGESLAHEKQHVWFIGEARNILSGRRPLQLPDDVPYYVTVDIDVLDPAQAPGTNSPVPGGLTYTELFRLLSLLLTGKSIVGMDLVEIDAHKDTNNCTVQTGLELLLFLMSFMRCEAE